MKIGFIGAVLTASLVIAANGSATAGPQFAVKVVDRIEYDGLNMVFCKGVGEHSYDIKGQGGSVFKAQDLITQALESRKEFNSHQMAVAKRIVAVLAARIFAEVPYRKNDPEMTKIVAKLSEVECIQGNNLIQGLTALDMLKATK